jgi:NhaP-type Na+/H+ or K+/H+ antiporter
MVGLPRNITAGAAARRSLLADTLIAAALATLAILLAAGIGVVGFVALLVFFAISGWIAVEWLIKLISRRMHRRVPASLRARRFFKG